MRPEPYIFDFDGTLVDSMPTWGGKMLHVLDKNGVSYPEDIVRTLTPLGDLGSARYFQEHFHLNKGVDELLAEMDEFALPAYRDAIQAKPGVREALEALRAGGHSLSVLTASPHRMLDPCLERLGLHALFDNVWSCDDFGLTKAQVEIYAQAAARLGRPVSECVFLDDNLGALRTAKQAGMRVIGVQDDSSRPDEAAIRALVSQFVTDLRSVGSADSHRAVPGSSCCRRTEHESVGHRLEPPDSSFSENSGAHSPHSLPPRILSMTPRAIDWSGQGLRYEPHRLRCRHLPFQGRHSCRFQRSP